MRNFFGHSIGRKPTALGHDDRVCGYIYHWDEDCPYAENKFKRQSSRGYVKYCANLGLHNQKF